MPRPKKCRWIQGTPAVNYFKPRGIPMTQLEEVRLPVEGLEAIRLVDVEGLDHEAAAVLMGVSRPTFTRILAEARKVVALALVRGWAIRIEGGVFEVSAHETSGDSPTGEAGRRGGRCGHGRWLKDEEKSKSKFDTEEK